MFDILVHNELEVAPRRRRIARTLVSERVRAVIAQARARGGRRIIVSDSEDEVSTAVLY